MYNYMQILLNHVRCPLSFDHLKIVADVLVPTFCEAVIMHRLLEMDIKFRRFFNWCVFVPNASYLVAIVCNHICLLQHFKSNGTLAKFQEGHLNKFWTTSRYRTRVRTQVLWDIFSVLESMGKEINTFHLLDDNIYIQPLEGFIDETN